jgi:hypothetical protein
MKNGAGEAVRGTVFRISPNRMNGVSVTGGKASIFRGGNTVVD